MRWRAVLDDEWLPSKLARHMRAFAKRGPEVGVEYSDMRRIHSNGTRKYHRSPSVRAGILIDPQTRFYQVCKLGIQSTVIRRPCLETVGGFNEASSPQAMSRRAASRSCAWYASWP